MSPDPKVRRPIRSPGLDRDADGVDRRLDHPERDVGGVRDELVAARRGGRAEDQQPRRVGVGPPRALQDTTVHGPAGRHEDRTRRGCSGPGGSCTPRSPRDAHRRDPLPSDTVAAPAGAAETALRAPPTPPKPRASLSSSARARTLTPAGRGVQAALLDVAASSSAAPAANSTPIQASIRPSAGTAARKSTSGTPASSGIRPWIAVGSAPVGLKRSTVGARTRGWGRSTKPKIRTATIAVGWLRISAPMPTPSAPSSAATSALRANSSSSSPTSGVGRSRHLEDRAADDADHTEIARESSAPPPRTPASWPPGT